MVSIWFAMAETLQFLLTFHIRGQILAGSSAAYNKKMFEGLDPNVEPSENMARFIQRLIDYPSGGWTRLPNWGDHVGSYFDLA